MKQYIGNFELEFVETKETRTPEKYWKLEINRKHKTPIKGELIRKLKVIINDAKRVISELEK